MNPDRLLKHFYEISEAPDAVPRLRRFILDLAVRGKLVEQDPNDEPASELLKRIELEKARLVKIGQIRKEKRLSRIEKEELLFNIPDYWSWTRMGNVTTYIQRGKSPKYGDGLPVISQKCVQWDGLHLEWAKMITLESLDSYDDSRILREGDLLWNSTGTGTIGRVIRVDHPGKQLVCDSHVTVVRCLLVDEHFVCIWLRSDYVYGSIEERAAGATNQVELTATIANNQITPLPPIAEQHRIVAKVDELMALCDELEAAQAKRERRRDMLVGASLHGLNNGASGDELRQNAGFYFNHLPHLTTRIEHIQQLRQTILNLAVRGKLVPQDPQEERVYTLISRIESERSRRAKADGLVSASTSAASEQGDFPIPKSWRWIRLGFVTSVVMGQSPPGETYNARGQGLPLINGPVEFSAGPFGKTVINQYTTSPTKLCNKGDLLLCVRGSTTGRTNVAGIDACIGRGVAALQPLYEDQFVRLFIWSWRDQIIEMGHGIAFPSISRHQIEDLAVPFPPLTEQHRIVAKVDELMALCDELQARINNTTAARCQLLEATLHEALSGQRELNQQASGARSLKKLVNAPRR